MKPKKVRKGINLDEDASEFLKTLSATHEASYFINNIIKESGEFKKWKWCRENPCHIDP